MHLAMAALIAGQVDAPCEALLDLIEQHLRRIEPTLSYAMAQDNNHGTSEAAALLIGGSWLASTGRRAGLHWQRLGRRWLENRAARLIAPDGSFSQHSVNYHRVMLDSLSMVEVWRRQLALPAFSPRWRERAAAAARWLTAMVDLQSGDAPNLGANDGARLLPLTDTDYRDFRPSLQLAMALFAGERAIAGDGDWNLPLQWLGGELPDAPMPAPSSRQFDDGGYALLRQSQAMALLRYPRFRFRPGHADALHIDLWVDGENLLRDGGSYSYNTDAEWLDYFPGTASHNTVQFDSRDQMPRLGRFLFGDWLRATGVAPVELVNGDWGCAAGYRDRQGASHHREVSLGVDCLRVRDQLAGFERAAVLRWRLRPGDWRIDGNRAIDGQHVITVTDAGIPAQINLVEGWESRYYMRKMPLPVLEVTVRQPGTLETQYRWR